MIKPKSNKSHNDMKFNDSNRRTDEINEHKEIMNLIIDNLSSDSVSADTRTIDQSPLLKCGSPVND
jgi:hypothetical protein